MKKTPQYAFFNDFFESRGILVPQNIETFEFVKSGVLDSFEILSLILQIELEFSISFSAEELLDEKNATIGGLLNSIEAKL
ncbi:hypothetical protein [Marinomonas sp. 2405UD68-3]|uniref:hypothetical protein n=1 Tax=Marinomonas sp. 2405UD68-3 TaxID=3391835 RepID=UPI0039C94463